MPYEPQPDLLQLPPERPGLLSRFLKTGVNALEGFPNAVMAGAHTAGIGQYDTGPTKPVQLPPLFELPPAETTAEAWTDVGGHIAGTIPEYVGGAKIGTAIARGIGAGRAASSIIRGSAEFGLPALIERPTHVGAETALGATVGGIQALPDWRLRALASLGLGGAAAGIAKEHGASTPQALIQGALMGTMGLPPAARKAATVAKTPVTPLSAADEFIGPQPFVGPPSVGVAPPLPPPPTALDLIARLKRLKDYELPQHQEGTAGRVKVEGEILELEKEIQGMFSNLRTIQAPMGPQRAQPPPMPVPAPVATSQPSSLLAPENQPGITIPEALTRLRVQLQTVPREPVETLEAGIAAVEPPPPRQAPEGSLIRIPQTTETSGRESFEGRAPVEDFASEDVIQRMADWNLREAQAAEWEAARPRATQFRLTSPPDAASEFIGPHQYTPPRGTPSMEEIAAEGTRGREASQAREEARREAQGPISPTPESMKRQSPPQKPLKLNDKISWDNANQMSRQFGFTEGGPSNLNNSEGLFYARGPEGHTVYFRIGDTVRDIKNQLYWARRYAEAKTPKEIEALEAEEARLNGGIPRGQRKKKGTKPPKTEGASQPAPEPKQAELATLQLPKGTSFAPQQTRSTPGTFQSVLKVGLEVDRDRAIMDVAKGDKPITISWDATNFNKQAMLQGLKVKELYLGRNKDKLFYAAYKREGSYNRLVNAFRSGDDAKIGKALGFTKQELAEFNERSARIDYADELGYTQDQMTGLVRYEPGNLEVSKIMKQQVEALKTAKARSETRELDPLATIDTSPKVVSFEEGKLEAESEEFLQRFHAGMRQELKRSTEEIEAGSFKKGQTLYASSGRRYEFLHELRPDRNTGARRALVKDPFTGNTMSVRVDELSTKEPVATLQSTEHALIKGDKGDDDLVQQIKDEVTKQHADHTSYVSLFKTKGKKLAKMEKQRDWYINYKTNEIIHNWMERNPESAKAYEKLMTDLAQKHKVKTSETWFRFSEQADEVSKAALTPEEHAFKSSVVDKIFHTINGGMQDAQVVSEKGLTREAIELRLWAVATNMQKDMRSAWNKATGGTATDILDWNEEGRTLFKAASNLGVPEEEITRAISLIKKQADARKAFTKENVWTAKFPKSKEYATLPKAKPEFVNGEYVSIAKKLGVAKPEVATLQPKGGAAKTSPPSSPETPPKGGKFHLRKDPEMGQVLPETMNALVAAGAGALVGGVVVAGLSEDNKIPNAIAAAAITGLLARYGYAGLGAMWKAHPNLHATTPAASKLEIAAKISAAEFNQGVRALMMDKEMAAMGMTHYPEATHFEKLAAFLKTNMGFKLDSVRLLGIALGDAQVHAVALGKAINEMVHAGPADLKVIHDWITGKLPDEVSLKNRLSDQSLIPHLVAFRAARRDVTKTLIAGIGKDTKLAKAMEVHMDDYITRTYKIYTEKHWTPDHRKIERAAEALGDDWGDFETRLHLINSYVGDIQKNRSVFHGLFRPDWSNPKGESLHNVLTKKENLSPEFLDLLGVYTDPIHQMRATAVKLVTNARTAEYFNQLVTGVRENGMPFSYTRAQMEAERTVAKAAETRGLAATASVAEREAGRVATLHLKELEQYGILYSDQKFGRVAGSYVHLEARDQFANYQTTADMFNIPIIRQLVDLTNVIKYGHTVASPFQLTRQIVGIPIFGMISRTGPTDWANAFRVIWDQKNNTFNKEVYDRLQRLGIVGGDLVAGELRKDLKSMSDSALGQFLDRGIIGKAKFYWEESFRTPDTMIRIAAFLKKEKQLQAKYADEGAAGMAKAEREAINFTNRYTMNYAALPPGVVFLRQLPFINQYLSFAYEMARITKNLGQDALKGDVYAMGTLGTMATLPFIAQKLSEMALSKKDREDWEKVKRLGPEYSRHNFKIVHGRLPNGDFRYTDMTPLVPHDPWLRMMRAIAAKDGEAFWAVNPLIGWQNTPVLNVGFTLAAGRELRTGQPIRRLSGDMFQAIRREVAPTLVGTELDRFLLAVTPNEAGGLGVTNIRTGQTNTIQDMLLSYVTSARSYTVKPSFVIKREIAKTNEYIDVERGKLRKVMASTYTPEAKAEAIEQFRWSVKQLVAALQERVGTPTPINPPPAAQVSGP